MTVSARIQLRPAERADAEAIVEIYNHYIAQSIATFELQAISADEMFKRMQTIQSLSLPWLLAERDGVVVGYAYAGQWQTRAAYRRTAEVTVYLDPGATRCGIGSALYARLLEGLKQRDFHVAIGGISLPNTASVALHEKFGFQKVAHYEQVGHKFDRWIDVGYWQRFV